MIAGVGRLAALRYLFLQQRGLVYTRQLLQELNVDKEQIKQDKLMTLQQTVRDELNRMPFNDSNPSNFVKVKVNHPLLFGDKPYRQTLPSPYIILPVPRKPRVLISAHKKYIKTSMKKMLVAVSHIKKMHVCQALYVLAQSQKKVAKLLMPTFFNLLNHAKKRGLTPYRLYVHGLILGKTQRYKGLRYHAKGRGCSQKTDICQIKVILHQMPKDEFFTKIANGEISAGLAQDIKDQLIKSNASFDEVRKYRHLITSRGRQQLKEQNRRKVDKQFKENAEAGTFLPKKVLLRQLLEREADKYEQLLEDLTTSQSTLKLRQALFKKNNE